MPLQAPAFLYPLRLGQSLGPRMQVKPEAGVGQMAFALQCFASSVGDRPLRPEELASYKILISLLAGFLAKVQQPKRAARKGFFD